MQDIRHAIETYMSQLVAFPDGRGTMHDVWLLDHPTPGIMDDQGLEAFLAKIAAAVAPEEATPADETETAGQPDDEEPPAEPEAASEADPASAEASANPAPELPIPEPTPEQSTEAALQAPSDDLPAEVRDLLNSTN